MQLKAGDKVVLLGCSNGQLSNEATKQELQDLIALLEADFQFEVEVAPTIFVSETTGQTRSAKERADYLVEALTDASVSAVFDLTGGDLANEVLIAINPAQWQALRQAKEVAYIGYSDNTVLLNALLSLTTITAINFLLLMVVRDESGSAYRGFKQVIVDGKRDDWQQLQELSSSSLIPIKPSELIGGNIRCFLKLAGTQFMPDAKNQGLLLEAQSGDLAKLRSYVAQLYLIGILDEIDFIILGKFSELEAAGNREVFETLIQNYAAQLDFAVFKTDYVGHHSVVFPFQMTQ